MGILGGVLSVVADSVPVMEITTGAPPTHPVLGLMGAVDSMLADILESPIWSYTDAERAEAVELAHKIVGRSEALRLRTIHDVDTHELASQAGATESPRSVRRAHSLEG